jgi:hypothetical protein
VCFLLLRAKCKYWKHRQRTLHRNKRAQTAIARLQLLTGQPITNSAHARTPIPLQVHPQQAQLRQFMHQRTRERTSLEMLANNRQNPLPHKLAHRIPHQALLIRKRMIQIIKISSRRQRRLTRFSSHFRTSFPDFSMDIPHHYSSAKRALVNKISRPLDRLLSLTLACSLVSAETRVVMDRPF